jgi:hypothetical protein
VAVRNHRKLSGQRRAVSSLELSVLPAMVAVRDAALCALLHCSSSSSSSSSTI